MLAPSDTHDAIVSGVFRVAFAELGLDELFGGSSGLGVGFELFLLGLACGADASEADGEVFPCYDDFPEFFGISLRVFQYAAEFRCGGCRGRVSG